MMNFEIGHRVCWVDHSVSGELLKRAIYMEQVDAKYSLVKMWYNGNTPFVRRLQVETEKLRFDTDDN